MEITLRIPQILCQYAHGRDELSLEGQTVGAVLTELADRFPLLYQCVCNETGAVRPHIHLFVNERLLDKREVAAAELRSGDVVSVFQAVSGG